MFGGAAAVKEEMKALRAPVPTAPTIKLTTGLENKLGKLYQSKGNTIDMGVPPGYFEHLQQQVLIEKGLAWINDFKEFRLTTKGLDFASKCALALPSNALVPYASKPTALQRMVRDARADWDMMTQTPFFLDKWWWRNTMWNFRKWWAGTNPNQQLLTSSVIVDRPPWSEEDELSRFRLWNESHYGAFWLCPDGVQAGLEKLNEFEAKSAGMGPNAWQVIAAVESIARLAGQLPPPKPLSVVEQIQSRMYDKSGDFKFEEFADRYGKILKVRWEGEAGRGKTFGAEDMTSEQLQAFISINHGKVQATEEAKKFADIQAGRDFDTVTKKTRAKKPKQFQLIDAFNKAYAELDSAVPAPWFPSNADVISSVDAEMTRRERYRLENEAKRR